MKIQTANAPIKTNGRLRVTFYSPTDLAETLKMAEQWHRANHLPAGEWAEEYAGYIFSRQGAEVSISQDAREIQNPCVGTYCSIHHPAYHSDDPIEFDQKIVGDD